MYLILYIFIIIYYIYGISYYLYYDFKQHNFKLELSSENSLTENLIIHA
jgi:hypothetical protein